MTVLDRILWAVCLWLNMERYRRAVLGGLFASSYSRAVLAWSPYDPHPRPEVP